MFMKGTFNTRGLREVRTELGIIICQECGSALWSKMKPVAMIYSSSNELLFICKMSIKSVDGGAFEVYLNLESKMKHSLDTIREISGSF